VAYFVCVIVAYYYGTYAGGVTNTLETATFDRPAQIMCSQNTALPVFNQNCNTLHHTATHCTAMHHNAPHCGCKCCATRRLTCSLLLCVGDSSCICPVVVACNLQPPLSFKLCLGLIVHAFVSPVQSSFRSYLGLF